MDGHCQNSKLESKIDKWLNDALLNRYWEKFEEIHINQIDNCFVEREKWLNGSIHILNIFRQKLIHNFEILLVIETDYLKESIKICDIDLFFLNEKISFYTPPAFYLFPKNDPNLLGTLQNLELVKVLNLDNIDVYLKKEVFDNEYLYTFYFLGKALNDN